MPAGLVTVLLGAADQCDPDHQLDRIAARGVGDCPHNDDVKPYVDGCNSSNTPLCKVLNLHLPDLLLLAQAGTLP